MSDKDYKMSNYAVIQPTVFQNHNTETKTYGVRVYDGYGQTYDNLWESIPDDDLEILEKVISEANDITQGILDMVADDESGIYVGETYLEWIEIKHLFS